MHTSMNIKALRAATLSVVALAVCAIGMAADLASHGTLVAKADTATRAGQFARTVPTAPVAKIEQETESYPTLAEAEMIGMGYADFDAVLAEALAMPTAAGYKVSVTGYMDHDVTATTPPAPVAVGAFTIAPRGAVEAVVARTMGGTMP